MSIICPTILAREPHEFREQIERIGPFAQRIHIDLADGEFTPTRTVEPERLWWPRNVGVDIHVMYQKPHDIVDKLIRLKPNLVIVHAQAEGNFVELAKKLHAAHIRVGVALLPLTAPEVIEPAIEHVDHVLIFSGSLGNFGGTADLNLLDEVSHIRKMKPDVEIGWDGGVSAENAMDLQRGGIDVLNTGGYIQKAPDPTEAYRELVKAIEE